MSTMTLSALLVGAIKGHGDRPAIRVDSRWLSYSELDEASDKLAGLLLASGATVGSRVALLFDNNAAYAIADIALLKIGATKVPLHSALSRDEISYCVDHAGARFLLHDERKSAPVSAAMAIGISVSSIAALPRPSNLPPAIEPDTLTLILYTGGTTGKPKGVCHSQRSLAINLLANVTCGDIRSDEVMQLSTPLAHSAGFHMQACLFQGGRLILRDRFDPRQLGDDCDQFGVTWTFMVPTMLYRFLDTMPESWTPTALRTLLYGAAPVRWHRVGEAIRRFGPVLMQLYGQSEAPNWLTRLSKEDHLDARLAGACGRAVPYAQVRLANICDGVGEVEAKSPYVLSEYLNNEEASKTTVVGGWLRTGDVARVDENGYFFLLDRKKDIVITGGFNVYCAEVEQAIIATGSVSETAVIGVPDEDWGERLIAYVIANGESSPDGMRSILKSNLSGYKIPKDIHFVNELPRTAFGKIDKKKLRADYMPTQ